MIIWNEMPPWCYQHFPPTAHTSTEERVCREALRQTDIRYGRRGSYQPVFSKPIFGLDDMAAVCEFCIRYACVGWVRPLSDDEVGIVIWVSGPGASVPAELGDAVAT